MLLHFLPLMVYPLVMLLLLSSLILAYLAFQIWFDQTQSNTSAQKKLTGCCIGGSMDCRTVRKEDILQTVLRC